MTNALGGAAALLVALAALLLGGASAQQPLLGSVVQRLAQAANRTSGSGKAACPPPGFDSLRDFNLSQYIAAPWYVQQQAPILYQPANNLYCVRAQYVPINPANLSAGLYVRNYANEGRVNGRALGTSGGSGSMSLVALPNPSAASAGAPAAAASKLLVGPAAVARFPQAAVRAGFGDYWVVDAGRSSKSSRGYDWAIVSGGAPGVPAPGGASGCRTGRVGAGGAVLPPSAQYFGGLWLFSRKPVDLEVTKTMVQRAAALGFDTSVLANVTQQGCTYAGA